MHFSGAKVSSSETSAAASESWHVINFPPYIYGHETLISDALNKMLISGFINSIERRFIKDFSIGLITKIKGK